MSKTLPTPWTRARRCPIPTGKHFGRWTVIGEAEPKVYNGTRSTRWLCQCECGTIRAVRRNSLVNGDSQSCGCLAFELSAQRGTTHGMSGSYAYACWQAMKARCYYKIHPHYANYGGRGIVVCQRWLDSFENFIQDMGMPPSEDHSIDRYPNHDGNYEADNCRWATPIEQQRNMRTNRLLTFAGKTQCVSAWAEESGIGKTTIKERLNRGWSAEDALRTAVRASIAEPTAGWQSLFDLEGNGDE